MTTRLRSCTHTGRACVSNTPMIYGDSPKPPNKACSTEGQEADGFQGTNGEEFDSCLQVAGVVKGAARELRRRIRGHGTRREKAAEAGMVEGN